MLQPEQDPPVYYSIVILTIMYYLRVADLMGITSPYPRENIIAGNYILADMRAYLNKRHRQQNKEILIKHSPGMGECFWFSGIQITGKIFSARTTYHWWQAQQISWRKLSFTNKVAYKYKENRNLNIHKEKRLWYNTEY